jgi:hypothetical protein
MIDHKFAPALADAAPSPVAPVASAAPITSVLASAPDVDVHYESDIFVCRRSSPSTAAARGVTLYVYGWHNVEPGPLSWAFPSLRAALDAVRTMRNAVQWCIIAGAEWTSIEAARAEGSILIEQLG